MEGWSLEERGVVIVVGGRGLIGRDGEDGRTLDMEGSSLRDRGMVVVLGRRGRGMEAGRDIKVMKREGMDNTLMH